MRPLATLATLLALAPSAMAETVGVVTYVDGGDVPVAAVQSIVWHALHERHGHEALILPSSLDDALETLKEHHLTTLYSFHVSWTTEGYTVDGGFLSAAAPEIVTTEYVVEDDGLRATTEWTTFGAVALYRVLEDHETGYLALPEVALQDAMGVGVSPVKPPTWSERPSEPVTIPIVVAADDEYRAFYGAGWRDEASERIDRASALLSQAGIALEVVDTQLWQSPDGMTELSSLLEHLAEQPLAPSAIRVGFTQQTALQNTQNSSVEDVGRAYHPGRNVVIADQALPPEHDRAWDVADEGVAVAHEVLHALGAPHLKPRHFLMSGVKGSTTHVMAPSTQQLARAAVQARYAHWDATVALESLSEAAEAWLADDPELQLAYLIDNLSEGPGMPDPGKIEPNRVSALTNLAIGHYYLDQAKREPSNATALLQSAIDHGKAAFSKHPEQAQQLLEDLDVSPTPEDRPAREEAPDLRICGQDWSPWAPGECATL